MKDYCIMLADDHAHKTAPNPLTSRERQVLQMIAQGYTSSQLSI